MKILLPLSVLLLSALPAVAQAPTASDPQLLGRTSLFYFNYAIGKIEGGPGCFSCGFFAEFISVFGSFSAALFHFAMVFLVFLAPLLLAIWFSIQAFILLYSGGVDGRGFMRNVVKRSTLFFFVWMVMTASNAYLPRDVNSPLREDAMPWAWQVAGPETAAAVFTLGQESREAMLDTEQANFGCEGILERAASSPLTQSVITFGEKSAELACIIERTHIVGMAVALAMMEGAWASVDLDVSITSFRSDISNAFSSLLFALFVSLFALALFVVFALSAVWFIFAVLDVVVRVLLMTGFMPWVALAVLFKPSRRYAYNALRFWLSGLAKGLGVGLVAALCFGMIISVPTVYNSSLAVIQSDPSYERLKPLEAGTDDIVLAFEEFIIRTSLDRTNEWFIPMSFTTPWFMYFMLIGLGMYALGRKVLTMIESIMGTPLVDNMADNAKNLASRGIQAGALLGVGAAALASRKGTLAGLGVSRAGNTIAEMGVKKALGEERGGQLLDKYNPDLGVLRGRMVEAIKAKNPFGNFRRGGVE